MNGFPKHCPNPALSDVKLAVCDSETFGPALRWLNHERPAETRRDCADPVRLQLEPENILAASRNGSLVGLVVMQGAPGRVGWIWPPVLSGELGPSKIASELARLLVDAAIPIFAERGLRLVQALVPPESDEGKVLESSGFVQMTEMVEMRRSTAGITGSEDSIELEFLSYGPATRSAFAIVLKRTYEASLDCPELDGLRPVEEVLEGYQASGVFHPDLWLLARRRGRLVGCVLLSHWPDEKRCELQYLGVVPEARGTGLGRLLCCRALRDARRLGASELGLGVDARNYPAMNLYKLLGFIERDRRAVWIHRLSHAAESNRA